MKLKSKLITATGIALGTVVFYLASQNQRASEGFVEPDVLQQDIRHEDITFQESGVVDEVTGNLESKIGESVAEPLKGQSPLEPEYEYQDVFGEVDSYLSNPTTPFCDYAVAHFIMDTVDRFGLVDVSTKLSSPKNPNSTKIKKLEIEAGASISIEQTKMHYGDELRDAYVVKLERPDYLPDDMSTGKIGGYIELQVILPGDDSGSLVFRVGGYSQEFPGRIGEGEFGFSYIEDLRNPGELVYPPFPFGSGDYLSFNSDWAMKSFDERIAWYEGRKDNGGNLCSEFTLEGINDLSMRIQEVFDKKN